MDHRSTYLLLLTCLADGPFSVVIHGVDVVTVGIPYGFRCSALCSPQCRFKWTRGNEFSYGSELSLKLGKIEPTQVLTCMAVNPATGVSASVQKSLQVTAGPSNIKISGPGALSVGAASVFTCSADCYPNCTYTWTVLWKGEPLKTEQGKTISITPPPTVFSETLMCQAQQPLSHLYITTSVFLWVATLYDISITGPDTVTMGQQYTFTCLATCTPSCEYTWRFRDQTFYGDQIQLPILHEGEKPRYASRLVITISEYSKKEPLICAVRNTASQIIINATKDLTLIDPFSVRPASKALPVSGEPFSLLCVGAQSSASITWQKNNHSMPTSQRVHLSSDGLTLTFSPVLQADGGLYHCMVSEGAAAIQSVGFNLEVNYGPDEVRMVRSNKGPVGEEMFTLPGSKTELQCSADCFPACSFTWFYHGTLLSTHASVLFTPTPPNQAALTCVAFNSVTKRSGKAETTVVVADGPENVTISGPESLEVGATAKFRCSAKCIPSCSFTWSVYGKLMTGSGIEITFNRYVSSESISCRAENKISRKTVTVNETLTVSGKQVKRM
ncbi:hypothetical protein LDENG_00057230 [Lucifuga dentata]|nr:hypothetical protein LDENG_00057230 [Lucifuga dentata]